MVHSKLAISKNKLGTGTYLVLDEEGKTKAIKIGGRIYKKI